MFNPNCTTVVRLACTLPTSVRSYSCPLPKHPSTPASPSRQVTVRSGLPEGAGRGVFPSHRRLNNDNGKHNTRSCSHSRMSSHNRLTLCSSHAHTAHTSYPPPGHTEGFTAARGSTNTLAYVLSSHVLSYHLPRTAAPSRSK